MSRWLAGLPVLAALTVSGCLGGAEPEEPSVPQGRFLATSRALTPGTHIFGDTVRAQVEVVVDRDRLDPARVRVSARFAPYRPVAEPRVERDDHGRYTRLHWQVTLRCLDRVCLPGQVSPGITSAGEQPALRRAERIFRFRPAHVYYDAPGAERPRHLKRVFWPRLETLSRISPRDPALTFFFATPFRTTLTPLPDLSYALSPAPLAVALLVGAGLLLLLPGWLLLDWRRRRRPEPEPEAGPELTAIERALLLVERSADAEERRQALEALARELDGNGDAGLAGRARRLAWSRGAPARDGAGELVAEVRQAHAE